MNDDQSLEKLLQDARLLQESLSFEANPFREQQEKDYLRILNTVRACYSDYAPHIELWYDWYFLNQIGISDKETVNYLSVDKS